MKTLSHAFVICLSFAFATLAVSAKGEAESPLDAWLTADEQTAIAEKWNDDIEALEALDAKTPRDPGAVLLLGSSSIRLWEDASKDLSPWPVIRRGYGGARYSDLVGFAKRLTQPHQYAAVVIFVGNDISGNKQDRTPEAVEPMVRHVVEVARKHQPNASILLVEVTPTPKRYHVWPEIRKLNAMLREVALTEPNTYFVATAEHYLDANDQPIAKLFRDDQLHQNAEGYALWTSLIKQRLADVVPTKVLSQ